MLRLELETLRTEVEKAVGPGPEDTVNEKTPYTPGANKVLSLATEEATALNHAFVGTEHVLLGLLGEGSGVALAS